MVMDERNLLREAMSMRTDEDRIAFVESLSPEEREELGLEVTQFLNEVWDAVKPVFDSMMDFVQSVSRRWSEISTDVMREIAEYNKDGDKGTGGPGEDGDVHVGTD